MYLDSLILKIMGVLFFMFLFIMALLRGLGII